MNKRYYRHRITKVRTILPPPNPLAFDKLNQEFPLNPNNSDKVMFKAEISKEGDIVTVNNVTYAMLHNEKWEWIIRYDDHGGTQDFHRHERVSLEDDSNVVIPIKSIVEVTKQVLFERAISDIKANYLTYRMRFCQRSSIDLY